VNEFRLINGSRVQEIRSLVVRSRPKSDESLFGFLLRLTELNSYPTPIVILNEAHLDWKFFYYNRILDEHNSNFDRLIHLTTITRNELRELLYTPATKRSEVMVLGRSVPHILIRAPRPKVCPECLEESQYCRKQWELAPFTSCVIHNRMLLQECHACLRSIRWYRERLCYCGCGADWRQARAPILSESDAVMGQLLYEAFGLIPRSVKNTNNPLCGLDFNSLLSALLVVASLDGSPGPVRKTVFFYKSNSEIHRKLSGAFAVFENWPNGFHNFLDRHFSRASQRTKGLRAALNPLKHRLCSRYLPTGIQYLLRQEFENYVLDHWDRKYRSARWLRTKSTGRYLTRMVALKILKVDVPVIDQLISSGKLKGVVRTACQRRGFILEAESVERLRQEWTHSVSLLTASKYLGITKLQTLTLVGHSLLIGTNVLSGDTGQLWRFDTTHLDKFLSNVFACAKTVHSVSADLMWRFRNLVDALCVWLVTTSWGIHTLIDDILTGVIIPQCLCLKKPVLNDLYFSREDIKRYVRTKLTGQTIERIRLAEETTEHGFKSQVLYFLAHKGFIKTETRSEEGIQCRVITAKAVMAFKAHYIGQDKLSREIGTSRAFLVRALRSRKIDPVSGKSVDGGPCYIYRREDILNLDLKKLKGSHVVDSRRAAEILSLKKKTIAHLVKNGVLRPYSKNSQRAGEYLFSRTYIEALVGQFVDLTNLISPTVAAKVLQVPPCTIYGKWIRSGYLKYEISSDRKRKFLVRSDVEQIASFMNSIVTRAEAAIILGVCPSYIKTIVRREQLKRIKNPYPLSFPYIIYSRSDFEKLRGYYRDAGQNVKGVPVRLSFRKRNLILASRLPVTQ
jgi:hypothetical protein